MSDPEPVWLLDGVRSPFGRFGGGLRDVPVDQLGVTAIDALRRRASSLVERADELIVGMAMIEGGLMVPARQVAVRAGLPESLPTLTIDRACCSGMTAVGLGLRAVRGGAAVALAMGLESMSRTPRLLHETRWGAKRGDLTVEDLVLLRSPLSGMPIAVYAGKEALERGVTRQQQDEWALTSHQRYFAAREAGYFDDEIFPVETGATTVAHDEQPRADSSLEALSRLPCVYDGPTVTAGNAPGLNDGVCALALGDEQAVALLGHGPLAEVRAHHQTAGSPTSAVYLPGVAIKAVLDRAGLTLDDLDVLEINEAYAATVLTSVRTLAGGDAGLERALLERTNINGGAVAIGHPTGASGARITLTAARELRRRGGRWAVAAICGGFGQTDAVLLRAD
jgi:acetyl-CoA C-acetyltransferase